ncbi:MAG: hypothetical protein DMD72_09900 [Gemmatimonadetes bacterium]|nr:MAG: hypothetical protein DMD72_09900 [Gemmatimonadota bacterium]PYO75973.1 MAG: hypothetical protein DMD63_15535 [Gemmatimonadota bacterium]
MTPTPSPSGSAWCGTRRIVRFRCGWTCGWRGGKNTLEPWR